MRLTRKFSVLKNSISPPEKMVRLHSREGSMIFAESTSNLFAVILLKYGTEKTLNCEDVYESQALDLRVNRKRFREELFE